MRCALSVTGSGLSILVTARQGSGIRIMYVSPRRVMSTRFLPRLIRTAIHRVMGTRYILWITSLRLLREEPLLLRTRPYVLFLLRLLFGCVFALFFLVQCSPVYADDYGDPSRVTPYTPANNSFVNVNGGNIAFYNDYVWITGSAQTEVRNWSTTKGLAKPGDILAISAYVWDNSDSFGNVFGSGYSDGRNFTDDGIQWTAYGKPGYANLLAIRDNVAYFKCVNPDYCWVESVVNLRHKARHLSDRNYILTSYIISGEASRSEEAASRELEQVQALERQDNSGKTQQNGLQDQAFQNKSTSLVSALTQVASAPASNCRVGAPVHGGAFSFDFCDSARPSWLRPLISIPVAVTSLLLSIHIIRTTASEIEKFKAGI